MQTQAKTIFYDIEEYYYLPFHETLLFKILIIAGILIIGVLVGYYLFKRRYRKKITSWQWALQEIAKLGLAQYTNKHDVKKLYFNLTGIIKQYLYKRYNWKIQNKTDKELVAFLLEKQFDPALIIDLQKMLEGAQWVKFANQDMIKTQVESDLKMAQKLVEQTKPIENKT
ncbi:MAG: hypothetical protein ABH827_05805 [bacterium]